MEKKETKKKVVKKTTSTTKKKATNKKTTPKKTIKETKKKVEVVEEKNIPEVKETTTKRETKKLVYGTLYFLCSCVWVIGGVNKAVVKEKFIIDIIVSIFLFVIAVIYFISYYKSNKNKID